MAAGYINREQQTAEIQNDQGFKPIYVAIDASPASTVCYLVIGEPLPRIEDSVRIGELLCLAVMVRAKGFFGGDAIPALLSSHRLPNRNRNRHTFCLPWNSNGNGRIDRLLLHVPDGIASAERKVMKTLRRIWSRNGGEWGLVLESIGDTEVGGTLMGAARKWQSLTPYLHPWHTKKNFGIEDQIRKECRERGIPESIGSERLMTIKVGNQVRRSIHFHRFRNKHGLLQPDRQGNFWRLTFANPIMGPLALGFGCHFGLGLFAPYVGSETGLQGSNQGAEMRSLISNAPL